jgi:hypothetical protein
VRKPTGKQQQRTLAAKVVNVLRVLVNYDD